MFNEQISHFKQAGNDAKANNDTFKKKKKKENMASR